MCCLPSSFAIRLTGGLISWVEHWGSTAQERSLVYACDGFLPDAQQSLFRAISVRASAAALFPWLCQLKVAPYSYDWIDNLGRQSPRRLTPGCAELEVGQRFMFIFRLLDFERDRQLTLLVQGPLLDLVLTYAILPAGEGCRLVAKLRVQYRRGPLGWLARWVLPAGDLLMMRRQLLNFKELAENTSRF